MRSMDYIGLVFCWIWFVLCALFLIAKKLDMWYSRKDKEKKTDVVCPLRHTRLNTTELFVGHCFKCIHKEQCKAHFKSIRNVKS